MDGPVHLAGRNTGMQDRDSPLLGRRQHIADGGLSGRAVPHGHRAADPGALTLPGGAEVDDDDPARKTLLAGDRRMGQERPPRRTSFPTG